MKSIKSKIIVFAVLFTIGLVVTYSNHFNNGFHFDDSHTIQTNPYITSLHNIPLFFKEIKTFSSMPSHWGFRPMVTTTLAIDYWLGGGLKPFYFHLSTFIWYIVLCILMYVMCKKILDRSIKHKWTGYFALFATALYAIHTANAETINYIISRSDVLSTLCIVASVVIYISYPKLRKWGIYIIPAIICVGFKETVIVLPLILFFYILFFEKKLSIPDVFRRENFKNFYKSIFLAIPILIAVIIFELYSISKVPVSGLSNISNPFIPYVLTQSYVWVHYFLSFILPVNLSADTDWTVIGNYFDDRIIIGVLFVVLLIFTVVKTSVKPEHRPISFGLIWFALALLPTSLIPLTEILNDHRIFFPFVGLAFSIVYALGLLAVKFEKQILKVKKYQALITILICIIFISYAYGTYQRNKVWKNDESLWKDVSIKSPNNGRGLMNYGLTQMAKGNYGKADTLFEEALKYTPYYTYLHINLGILKNAMGKTFDAENYFLNAIQYGSDYNEPYYYYANFLKAHDRVSEARTMSEKSLKINPDYMPALYQVMDIYQELTLWDKLDSVAKHALSISPKDTLALRYLNASKTKSSKTDEQLLYAQQHPTAENYLNLSLAYYQKGLYEKCITACEEALKLNPKYADAYNNMCSAYNALGKYEEGIKACEKALAIKPDYPLAKNNLNWAKSQLKK